jgi:hypothetical protein
MGRWVDLIGPGSGWAIFWPAHSKKNNNTKQKRKAQAERDNGINIHELKQCSYPNNIPWPD